MRTVIVMISVPLFFSSARRRKLELELANADQPKRTVIDRRECGCVDGEKFKVDRVYVSPRAWCVPVKSSEVSLRRAIVHPHRAINIDARHSL